MKILHTADWHLGRKLEGRSRTEEQVAVLEEICRIADDEDVDAVLIAGDVFDTYRPPPDAEALFFRTMVRLAANGKRAVIVIAGNHDSPDRLIAPDPYARALGISTLGYPKDIPSLYDFGTDMVACVESAPSRIRLRLPKSGKTFSIVALPYPSETRLREVLTENLADEEQGARDYNARVRSFLKEATSGFAPGDPLMIASHLFVRNGEECESERQIQVGGAYTVDSGSFPASAAYVALGHLHKPQNLQGERDIPVRYSGSPLQYSFSEAGQQKSVTIVEFDSGKCTHRAVPLASGHRLERWNLAGTAELEARLAATDLSTLLAIQFTVDEPLPLDYLARIRASHPGILNLHPLYTKLDTPESGPRITDLPLEEQFRQYVQSSFNEPCNEEVMKLFLELAATDENSDEDS